jgi:hypothetical protein
MQTIKDKKENYVRARARAHARTLFTLLQDGGSVDLCSKLRATVNLRQKYASCDSMPVVYFMSVRGISASISAALNSKKLNLKTSLQLKVIQTYHVL